MKERNDMVPHWLDSSERKKYHVKGMSIVNLISVGTLLVLIGLWGGRLEEKVSAEEIARKSDVKNIKEAVQKIANSVDKIYDFLIKDKD